MSATPLFLLARASALVCAIPVSHVAETMRPLPVTPLTQVPAFVRGVATLRGSATPVLDLGEIVTGVREREVSRFVRLRSGARSAALCVASVLGVRRVDGQALRELPPLLEDAAGGALEALGTLDREVFVALRVSRLVPSEVWAALAVEVDT